MDNRKKNILLGLLIVGIISMTIAFAALTTRLSLNGTANVAATSWNIHFDSWTSVTQSTVDNHQNTAEINESQITQTTAPNITKIDNVGVTLNQPGDYIRYNFIIENEGSIDGKLSNFTKTMTPTNDVVGLTVNCYELSSREGTPITTNYVLRAGETIYCYFEVKYNDATNTSTAGSNQVYTQSAINASISANWTWIQSDTQASVATGSAATSGGNAATSGGNSQSGGNQSAYTGPYATDFSGTYGYAYYGTDYDEETGELIWANQIPNNMQAYLRKITTGDTVEVCGTFTGGTVCIPYTSEVFSDFGANNTISGYVAGKKAEMEAKGAECEVLYNDTLSCADSNGMTCDITEENGASCYKVGDEACTLLIGNDGSCNE